MSGFIYTMYEGADPGHGWEMSDPCFGKVPTLGACVPNIRRVVKPGDYIFVVSGRVRKERQFVVGGFAVAEKINALAAFKRFPDHRLHVNGNGQLVGNIIVDSIGKHHPLDEHDNFESRLDNYIVGRDAVVLDNERQFNVSRDETLDTLGDIFNKQGIRVFDIIGRHRKMTDQQVNQMLAWLKGITGENA